MSSINTNNSAVTNPQLAGILNTASMPTGGATSNGTPFSLTSSESTYGGTTRSAFEVLQPGATTSAQAGSVVVGGGDTAPANGAQPAAPPTTGELPPTTVGSTTTPATADTKTTAAGSGAATDASRTASAESGFGKAERDKTMKVSVAGDASFSFPSFNASDKKNTAPDIKWGDGWKRVEKNGMYYMEHTNGSKAVPALEYRMNTNPPGKVKTVKVGNGWGKKFPDGTVLVFDRTEGPYRLDPKGVKHKVDLGTFKVGGIKVRVFEASVVRTLEPSGKVTVFDSRGNTFAGTDRGRLSEVLSSADAGASISGGGKADGGGAPGKTVAAGGSTALTTEDLAKNITHVTEVARGLLAEIQGGKLDSNKLASLQAQLNSLPAGVLQAVGAAGTVTTEGSGTPGTTTASSTTTAPPTTGGGTTTVTAPIAGRDVNAETKKLAAGATVKIDATIPETITGSQKRFGQLPQDIQEAIATALGSKEGAGALAADQMVTVATDGNVALVGGGTVTIRHARQVTGAGPGVDIAATMRPGRQPGMGRAAAAGGGTGGTSTSNTSHTSHTSTATAAPDASNTVVFGGASTSARRKPVFGAGETITSEALKPFSGSFTWTTLPAAARTAIQANQTYRDRFESATGNTGTWNIDPNSVIVLDKGVASFIAGLAVVNPNAPATNGGAQPPAGSGATSTNPHAGHDATHAPTSGGGGASSTRPPATGSGSTSGTNPAAPAIPPAPAS